MPHKETGVSHDPGDRHEGLPPDDERRRRAACHELGHGVFIGGTFDHHRLDVGCSAPVKNRQERGGRTALVTTPAAGVKDKQGLVVQPRPRVGQECPSLIDDLFRQSEPSGFSCLLSPLAKQLDKPIFLVKRDAALGKRRSGNDLPGAHVAKTRFEPVVGVRHPTYDEVRLLDPASKIRPHLSISGQEPAEGTPLERKDGLYFSAGEEKPADLSLRHETDVARYQSRTHSPQRGDRQQNVSDRAGMDDGGHAPHQLALPGII